MPDGLPAVVPTSSLTAPAKSALRNMYERIKAGGDKLGKAKLHAASGAAALRQGGESAIIGAALGALDVELKTGLEIKKVPIDAAFGAGALIASVAWAGEEFSADLRNAGSAAIAVSAYRKTHDFLAEKKVHAGGTPGSVAAKAAIHGDFGADVGTDPILAAAVGF
jgi:hypothetical protein